MITLPAGFNAGILFNELMQAAAPFVGIAMIITCGAIVSNLMRRQK